MNQMMILKQKGSWPKKGHRKSQPLNSTVKYISEQVTNLGKNKNPVMLWAYGTGKFLYTCIYYPEMQQYEQNPTTVILFVLRH